MDRKRSRNGSENRHFRHPTSTLAPGSIFRRIYLDIGRLWAPFWQPLGPFGSLSAPFWARLAPLWHPFRSILVTYAPKRA